MKNSSASAFLISLLLILSFSFGLSAKNRTCSLQDHITVTQIYEALGISPPAGDCCNWEEVVCDRHPPYPITQLNFIDNYYISGQISDVVSDLSSLSVLRFSGLDNLTGNIPPGITKLQELTTIVISNTGLSGQIPTFLVNIKKLSYLDLSSNALTGSIPPELSQCPKLNTLDLSGNQLTGTIPETFGHFKSDLKVLILSLNFLTGTIPKSLGNLKLVTIGLSQNHFIGDASFLFGKNKTVQNLYIQQNNLTFDLTNLEFPQFLGNLNLRNNNIFGKLPQQLTQLILKSINVSNNKLCGEIPQGGSLQSFGSYPYINNTCLCDSPLPPCK